MRNIRNFGMLTGRLTKNPDFHENKDGSKKVRFTIAVPNQFTDKDGNRNSQFVPLEAFISNKQDGNGVYDCLEQGDLITCSYTIQNNNYKNKSGSMVYGLTLLVDSVSLLETKASKEARQAAKAAA